MFENDTAPKWDRIRDHSMGNDKSHAFPLSRARRNTTADWHESCATSSIGSVCRSRSSLSLAPRCTAVYTTLLPGISVTTASRSRMLPLAVNYDPLAAIKLSFPATTRARSVVGPSLSLAQRSGLTARLNCCNSRDHRTYLKVFLVV